MTLGEHLDELRVRLIRSAIALVVVFTVAWFFHKEIAERVLAPGEQKAIPWLNESLLERKLEKLIAAPSVTREELEKVFVAGAWLDGFDRRLKAYSPEGDEDAQEAALEALVGDRSAALGNLRNPVPDKLRADAAQSGMVFYLKVCFYLAAFIGGPFMLWQLWAFVAAGLYKHEKRVVYGYAPFSMGLFVAGAAFGYFYMVPYALFFLSEMGIEQFNTDLRLELYLSFFTKLSLGLGVVFQLPILMIVLARTGLVDPKIFGRYRGHFWIGSLVFSAILTPPDPYTQVMMAGPMAVLYEVGILLAKIAARRVADKSVVEAGA